MYSIHLGTQVSGIGHRSLKWRWVGWDQILHQSFNHRNRGGGGQST